MLQKKALQLQRGNLEDNWNTKLEVQEKTKNDTFYIRKLCIIYCSGPQRNLFSFPAFHAKLESF